MILRLAGLFLLLVASPLSAQRGISIDYARLRDETARRLSGVPGGDRGHLVLDTAQL